ncbi:MAG: PAS domain-containing protein [Alphaproteobacteria bacterium]|nr:PAS domain-containing protein [Alphaproteobacteria bacterium]
MASLGTSAQQPAASLARPDDSDAHNWIACDPATAREAWHPKLQRFFDYWLAILPPGRLPGRQHLDPVGLGPVLPHVWMLDVVRDTGAPRFRYRLAGTREVDTLQREVTGQWFDEVHRLPPSHPIFARLAYTLEHRAATYRRGAVGLTHEKDHRTVENCMLPFASDGVAVDLVVACSIIFYSNGQEVG